MKNTLILVMTLMLWCILLQAQQSIKPGDINQLPYGYQAITSQPSYNYIRTYTYLKGTYPAESSMYDVNIDIQYYDGLGRAVQRVALKGSPTGKDIVALQTYDAFGRADKSYMPYASSTTGGVFVPVASVIGALPAFLGNNYELSGSDGNFGYAKPAYESSPLNRVLQQGAPGAEWQPGTYPTVHPDQFAYQTNTTAVSTYKYIGDSYSTLSYAAGKLYVVLTTDGDGKQSRTYTDFQGKVIMKESYDGSQWLQTKYCYDDFDLLRCVMQPLASSPANTEYCFFYKYDSRRRLTDKRVPGSDWEYMIYDARDRLVLSCDGNSRALSSTTDRWYYHQYDDLNRETKAGYIEWSQTTVPRQTLVNYSTFAS